MVDRNIKFDERSNICINAYNAVAIRYWLRPTDMTLLFAHQQRWNLASLAQCIFLPGYAVLVPEEAEEDFENVLKDLGIYIYTEKMLKILTKECKKA